MANDDVAANSVLRQIEWLAIEGNLIPEQAIEQIASLATGYRIREREGSWGEPYERAMSNTASADVDYRAAWEASVKVVVAAGRFIEAEREGNAALIEDAHFGLLKALADYRAGGK